VGFGIEHLIEHLFGVDQLVKLQQRLAENIFPNIFEYVLEHILRPSIHPSASQDRTADRRFQDRQLVTGHLGRLFTTIRCRRAVLMNKRVQRFISGAPNFAIAVIGASLEMFFLALPALPGQLNAPREHVSREAALARHTDASAVSKQELQAKMEYCQECHGSSAKGFHGYYPIPRLAGQQPEYLKNQLQAFVERRRKNNIMFHVSRVLSPAMITALVANFHDLNPKPLTGAQKELISAGKKIFEEGVPDADVPACSSCHAPDAKGNGPFPRLAGQLFDYISNKLTDWDKERGQDPANPDTSATMQSIARGLTKSQIQAVAAYLSDLE
jgi:cytochrome c553